MEPNPHAEEATQCDVGLHILFSFL